MIIKKKKALRTNTLLAITNRYKYFYRLNALLLFLLQYYMLYA